MVKQKESFEKAPVVKPVSKKLKKLRIINNTGHKKKSIKGTQPIKSQNHKNKDQPEPNDFEEAEENNVHEIDAQDNGNDEIVSEVSEENINEEETKLEEPTEPEPAIEKNQLIKALSPGFIISAIYTGGKIQLSSMEKELYSICNNEIVCFSLEDKKVKRKITQVIV